MLREINSINDSAKSLIRYIQAMTENKAEIDGSYVIDQLDMIVENSYQIKSEQKELQKLLNAAIENVL